MTHNYYYSRTAIAELALINVNMIEDKMFITFYQSAYKQKYICISKICFRSWSFGDEANAVSGSEVSPESAQTCISFILSLSIHSGKAKNIHFCRVWWQFPRNFSHFPLTLIIAISNLYWSLVSPFLLIHIFFISFIHLN